MEIRIVGEGKEIAALIKTIQERQPVSVNTVVDAKAFAKAVHKAMHDIPEEFDGSKKLTL